MEYPPIFPSEKPKPTTTAAPTTTASQSTSTAAANDSSSAASTTSSTSASTATDNPIPGGRKKRSQTISTGYNYINVDVVTFILQQWK